MALASWTSGAFGTSNQYINYTITITLNSQNITSNTSNVTVSVIYYRTNTGYTTYGSGTVTCVINGTTYTASVDSSQKITNSGIILFSKTLNISHDSDGSKTLVVSASISHSRFSSSSNSYSHALNTIPRKSTMTVGNGTFGTSQTITVSRKSTSFTHTIELLCGKTVDVVCTKSTATTIKYAPPLKLTTQDVSNVNLQVTFRITTYNGNTNIGTNAYIVMLAVPSSIKPSCKVTVSDPTGYADKYGGYVKGKSKMKVNVIGTPSYECPITAYNSLANGSKYTSSSFTTGVVASTGTLTISSTVTDKRGRSDSASAAITSLAYSNPNVSKVSVNRCNEDGTNNQEGSYVKVTFDASVTGLNNKNSANYTLKYKKSSESSYSNTVPLSVYSNNYSILNGSYVFFADPDSSYNVMITATDDFTSDSRTVSVSTAFTLMHFSAGGTGIAIGKIVEQENLFDVGLPANFMNDITYSGALTKTSDIREKNPLGKLTEEEMQTILSGSEMHKFTYKSDISQIVNYGIYAQQLRDLLISSGLGHMAILRMELRNTDGETTTDLTTSEEEIKYTVDYMQYIPFLIAGWQYHERKIAELELRLLEMKGGDSDGG